MKDYYIVDIQEKGYEGGILFWKPDSRGYTSDPEEAGKYTKKEAMEITKNNAIYDKMAINVFDFHRKTHTRKYVDFNELQKFKNNRNFKED